MKSTSGKRQAAIAFIMVTLFIDILGIGIVIPVLPILVGEFVGGGTPRAALYYSIITASYALMQFTFAPLIGALSDRFGRRPIILGSLFGLGIDFLIQGFAQNIWWLFVGRLLAGIMGGSITTANAYIADISTAENRARNFGMVGAMFGLGFIFGPGLGGLLGSYELRLPFFVAAGLALVNWLYGFFILPESLPPDKRGTVDFRRANPFGSFKHLTTYPLVAGLAVAFGCMSLAQRGLENVWVLSMEYRFDWGTRTNGFVLMLVGVMAAIVQGGLVRPIVRRFGERTALRLGLSVLTISFTCYGLATEGWMIICIIIFGAIGYISGPAIQSMVAGTVDPTEQGRVQGALTSLMSLTSIIAPLIFTGGVLHYVTSDAAVIDLPGAPFLVASIFLAVALVVVIRLFRRMPEEDAAAEEGGAGSDVEPTAEQLR